MDNVMYNYQDDLDMTTKFQGTTNFDLLVDFNILL
jgi:hypothetical protein